MADMTREEIEDLIRLHLEAAELGTASPLYKKASDFHSKSAIALRQLLQEREWRPIDTAPGVDGKNRILVWSIKFPPGDQVQIRLADGEWWRQEKAGPTHWMPLPLPPSPSSEFGG